MLSSLPKNAAPKNAESMLILSLPARLVEPALLIPDLTGIEYQAAAHAPATIPPSPLSNSLPLPVPLPLPPSATLSLLSVIAPPFQFAALLAEAAVSIPADSFCAAFNKFGAVLALF